MLPSRDLSQLEMVVIVLHELDKRMKDEQIIIEIFKFGTVIYCLTVVLSPTVLGTTILNMVY